MEKYKMLVKGIMKDNRFKVLLGILIISLVTSLISVLVNQFNLFIVGIIITTVISLFYLVNIQNYVFDSIEGNEKVALDLFKVNKISKKALLMFAGYIVIAIATFFGVRLLSRLPQLGIFFLIILLVSFVLVSVLVNVMWFSKKPLIRTMKEQNNKLKILGSIMAKYLTTIIQGVILIVLVNIFVYAPQIAASLELGESASTEVLRQLFSSELSNFVQMCGVQVIVYYLLFISSVHVSSALKLSNQLVKEV